MTNNALRFGNSAFATSTENLTNDANGCYRVILMRSLGYEDTPATPYDWLRQNLTFELGHAHETVMTRWFVNNGHKVEQERAITGIFEDWPYTGHIDLTVDDAQLMELKSVSSINTYVQVFIENQYKLNNLAQLVSYLYFDNKVFGLLRYTSFIYSPAAQATGVTKSNMSWPNISPSFKDFQVLIDRETGIIKVDNSPIALKLDNMLQHKKTSVEVIRNQIVHPVPLKTKICSWCTLRSLCSSFNKQEISSAEWLAMAKLTFSRSNHGNPV